MKKFDSLQKLLTDLESLEDGWVYLNLPLSELEKAWFLLTEGNEDIRLEQVEVEGESFPKVVYEQGLHRLLDIATLQDIVYARYEAIPNATVEQLAAAIRYYVVEDTFLD